MKCVNFDVPFRRHLAAWVEANRKKYGNAEKLEVALDEKMLDLVKEWEETPADWLSGVSPAAYFQQFDNAKLLVDHLHDYVKQRVPIPDLLLERIKMLKDSEPCLAALVQKEGAAMEVRTMALDLLEEIESVALVVYAVSSLAQRTVEEELADHFVSYLKNVRGPERTRVLELALEAYADATAYGKRDLIDVLSIFHADARVYAILEKALVDADEDIALYAAYLGEYSDARALDVLQKTLVLKDVGYLDFIEIRNSIEALGGKYEGEMPNFEGDPQYEAVKLMK